MNRFFYLILFSIIIWSCKKDDDKEEPVVVPAKSLKEVSITDDEAIVSYLKSHYYNYEEFANPPADFDYKIKIDSIEGDNANKESLFENDNLITEEIKVSSIDFGIDDEEVDVIHKLYSLIVTEGKGSNPSVADSVYLKYEGKLLNGKIFDSNKIWFDLQGTGSQSNGGVIEGFQQGLPEFKSGDGIVNNPDGTFEVENFGKGLIFMPSGLAYFRGTQPGKAYSPLIFEIDLYAVNSADHDRDGVPSIVEDLNNDKNLFNDDTDEDKFPNYLDADDDNDGKLTKDEIVIDAEGNITYPDSDNDGVPDYLDSDS
ncbi:MAG: FKBP-type peptidyl-prolyl cis-trans isomerase [Cellulophaga sp.]